MMINSKVRNDVAPARVFGRQLRAVVASVGFVVGVSAAAPRDCQNQPQVEREREERPPRPGDKRVNEGALGRQNATEAAARSAETSAGEQHPAQQ